jgi:ribosomal subunit interface protein
MISITSKNIEISEETKSYITEKFSELDKYLDKIQYIDVIVDKDNFHSQINMKIGLDKMGSVTLKEKGGNVRQATDSIRDRAKNKLRRLKEKAYAK